MKAALTGNRTQIYCLEGSNANLYTIKGMLKPSASEKRLNVKDKVNKCGEDKKLFLSCVGFEPTPTIVDQNAYVHLKSGAFDHSAKLTRLESKLMPTFT